MYYNDNWEETKKHYEAFFNKDYIDRCNLSFKIPRAVPRSELLPVDNTNPEDIYFNKENRYNIWKNTVLSNDYLAEGIPTFCTYFGTASHAGYFGAKTNCAPDTIWFDPALDEPDADEMHYDESETLLNKQKEVITYLAERSKGDFFTSMTDNCGILDGLANLRGSQELLMDLLEDPDFVHEGCAKLLDVWKKTQTQFFDIIKENNLGGSSHGFMNLWCPGRHSQIQCDFSVMISPAMYEEFVLPELEECSKFLDYTTYHLDGMEQTRHLDIILSVKGIDNIQWTPVAGQPKTSYFIKELQKIQAAGKGLILLPDKDEVPFLMENLSHKGLHMVVRGNPTVDEAHQLMELGKKLAH